MGASQERNGEPSQQSALVPERERTQRSGLRLDMWPCDGAVSERFVRHAPSAHTPVRFLSPRRDTGLCVTAETTNGYFGTQVRSTRVKLSRCAHVDSQAWSTTDLATTVGQFVPDWTHDLAVSGSGHPGAVANVVPMAESLAEQWTLSPSASGVASSPIDDLASCLTAGSPGAQMTLTGCNGGSAQSIVPIFLGKGFNAAGYVLATDDGSHCLREGKATSRKSPPAVVGACPDLGVVPPPGIWSTEPGRVYNGVLPAASSQFEQFYADPWVDSDLYGMNSTGTASGSAVVLTADQAETQIWTDISPGTLQSGNVDGSISIRPLNDLNVCLTVPSADYALGVSLQVQTCSGAADQEFSAVIPDIQNTSGPAQFRPFSATGLCVTPLKGLVDGSPIGLQACNTGQVLDQDDLWSGTMSWTPWAFPSH